jgi:transcriptional regulator with XRE-family HTH domain
MTDTLATVGTPSGAPPGGVPAAPAPSPSPSSTPAPASASTAPPGAGPRPSAPPNPRSSGFSPKRNQMEEAAARAAGEVPGEALPPPDQQQQPPADAGARTKVGRYEVSETQLGEMLQRQAQEDLRRATVPASAEAYEAKLPADLKLPGGQQFKIDASDPSFIAARDLAFAKGWTQQDLSDALGIFASHLAGQEFQMAERSRAELAKAGANAPQRVDAVGKWITAEMGEADSKPIRATIVTDAHLRFYERLMAKAETQGVGRFSQSHRVAPEDQRIPGYENMSFEQRRFAQDQMNARRNSR